MNLEARTTEENNYQGRRREKEEELTEALSKSESCELNNLRQWPDLTVFTERICFQSVSNTRKWRFQRYGLKSEKVEHVVSGEWKKAVRSQSARLQKFNCTSFLTVQKEGLITATLSCKLCKFKLHQALLLVREVQRVWVAICYSYLCSEWKGPCKWVFLDDLHKSRYVCSSISIKSTRKRWNFIFIVCSWI